MSGAVGSRIHALKDYSRLGQRRQLSQVGALAGGCKWWLWHGCPKVACVLRAQGSGSAWNLGVFNPLCLCHQLPMGRGQVWKDKRRGLTAERRTQPALTAPCSTKSNPRCRQITHVHRANEEAFLGAGRLWSVGGHEEEDGTSGSSTMESKPLGEGDSPIKKKKKKRHIEDIQTSGSTHTACLSRQHLIREYIQLRYI